MFFELVYIPHIVVIYASVGKLSVRKDGEMLPIRRHTVYIVLASEKRANSAVLIGFHPISRSVIVFEKPLYRKFGHEFCGHEFPEAVVFVLGQNLLPIVLYVLVLEVEIIVEDMTVLKPHTMKVAQGVPTRFHILLRRTADNLKSLVKSVVTRHSVARASAYVVAPFPKRAFKFAFCVLFHEPTHQKSAIARSNPLDRSIEARMEHQSVFHII